MLVNVRTPAAVSAVEHGRQPVGLDGARDHGPVDGQVVHAGYAGQVGHGADHLGAHLATGAGAASRPALPDSTARPSRMIVTRSASRSTSLRMWLDSSTVVPLGRPLGDALGEDLLHQRVQPRGRLVEDQQVGGRGERRDQGDLLPVALGVGAALLGRVELEALEHLGAPRVVAGAPRIRSSRSITSPPLRLGHRLTSPGT